ncbi:M23 family metallopeptidase [uncultured Sphingomonas sp.]|uniref:M23 family metallopeptidase n=1 Tax=uncultured Sphingomonas sp. TaxID=158754 RepID=UPI0025F99C11|nr:M23 family metallopeptidase [uncultured Sphingomonas sp.]
MTTTPAPAAPAVSRGRRARRFGLYVAAFLAMGLVAIASMVRFTGRVERVEAPPAPVAAAPGTLAQPFVAPSGLVIPVQGVTARQIVDTWGQSRAEGARAHQGTDIMAPGGTPVLAAAAGTVEKIFDSGAGGHTLYIRSRDGRFSYYYAHLAAYAAEMREGAAVRAGQHIGFVGDTGNAGAGNYHLHFGVARMAPGERWYAGTPINPYPLLAGSAPTR